jgi:hypothetical protein
MAKKSKDPYDKNHIHKYILADIGRNKEYLVYMCALSCNHYKPAAEVVGLDTICWRCGRVCQVPRMRRNRYVKRPHCVSCVKEYKSRLPKPSSMPVDLKKLEEMSIEDLLQDDDLFNPDKKDEH